MHEKTPIDTDQQMYVRHK